MNAQRFQLQTKAPRFPHQADHHQRGGNTLGYHGGDGHTRHVQVEDDDQQQVQRHIHRAGQQQKIQRPPSVSLGAQKRRAEIIKHHGGHSQKEDTKVQHGQVQHGGGSLHPDQHLARARDPHGNQRGTAAQRQKHGGVDRGSQLPLPLCPEIPGRQNVGAHGKSDEQVRK
ncbi:hypothetical protein SDC9_90175 [bioreactor metagenome]|uniref:Uncharacterized protein n=1 Tax=bioreactor metagenome TaxID=1076179 RepID=A0A644ZRA7_9ZZZZ